MLLRGETIDGTWTDFRAEMLPEGRPMVSTITEPGVLVYEREIGFEIFGQRFNLGTKRMMLETVVTEVGATAPDGSFEVVFKPGSSDRYVRSFVQS